MNPSSPRLSRAALRRFQLEPIHVARNITKADVHRFEWPPQSGEFAVVKDMRARPLWFRLVLGRAALGREWKALRALGEIEGVPKPIARLDADAFVMEWRAGTPAMHFANSENTRKSFVDESVQPQTASMNDFDNDEDELTGISTAVLERVARLLDASHARGVTHGDLHRNNILIAPDESVTLIDWATACVFGPNPRGPESVDISRMAFARCACARQIESASRAASGHARRTRPVVARLAAVSIRARFGAARAENVGFFGRSSAGKSRRALRTLARAR
jgi:aminoglycoside phosphotransferase (APT) family kinase protein